MHLDLNHHLAVATALQIATGYVWPPNEHMKLLLHQVSQLWQDVLKMENNVRIMKSLKGAGKQLTTALKKRK